MNTGQSGHDTADIVLTLKPDNASGGLRIPPETASDLLF